MMEDIHKLAVSPHGEALRIPTFSGVVPPPLRMRLLLPNEFMKLGKPLNNFQRPQFKIGFPDL